MSSAALDSVPVAPSPAGAALPIGPKLMGCLFLICLIVNSEPFINQVIAKFGDSAVNGRAPTSWGTVVQAVFIVIFYALASYLNEKRII